MLSKHQNKVLQEKFSDDIGEHIIPTKRTITDKSIISQREIAIDTEDYLSALRACLRQAPDVILMGEMKHFISRYSYSFHMLKTYIDYIMQTYFM